MRPDDRAPLARHQTSIWDVGGRFLPTLPSSVQPRGHAPSCPVSRAPSPCCRGLDLQRQWLDLDEPNEDPHLLHRLSCVITTRTSRCCSTRRAAESRRKTPSERAGELQRGGWRVAARACSSAGLGAEVSELQRRIGGGGRQAPTRDEWRRRRAPGLQAPAPDGG
nr:unnamed protein product [Digitaria exilis]